MVTADVGSAPCGANQPVMMPPAYLKFESSDLFGARAVLVLELHRRGRHVCDSGGGLFGSFSEPIDNGWRGIESYDSVSGTLCYAHATASAPRS